MNGVVQTPIEGTSLLYTFNDAKAPERQTTQYFEMFGNRGGLSRRLARRGPSTARRGRRPTSSRSRRDVWDLYNVKEDFSLANNLASAQPAKLKEMQDLFMKEAEKYHVLPIDDRTHRAHQRRRSRAGPTCSATARASRSTRACRACWKTPS